MEQPTNDAGINGTIITITLWFFSHMTANQFATYCTIASALITIYINLHKHFNNGKDKH